jgi:hypothetical protein
LLSEILVFGEGEQVMDINQLRALLKQLGVKPPEEIPANMKAVFDLNYELRASLYIPHLLDTQTFFTTTMAQVAPNGLGADYEFVRTAVTSSNLINELAHTLDLFVAPAVERAREQANVNTFQAYFNNQILNANYDNNVTTFLNTFPITDHALLRITGNFQRNIREACTRIIQDKAALVRLYNDQYPYLTLKRLKEIKSTGSDFHKGGKQVLILTFSVSYVGRYPMLDDVLKVVYKPSDVEVDCLLIGNSAAVTRADPNCNINESLTEIVNDLIDPGNNPAFETLPTYRILPRAYTSLQPQPTVYPLPIRDAYGYIEYLEYEASYGLGFYYYPFASSDYLIFRSQDETPIIRKFYRQMGQWLAIASTFSLQDLHLQNVRAMNYMPYLIDLEISLVKPINDVAQTDLFLQAMGVDMGGITGEQIANEEYVWNVTTQNQEEFISEYFPAQNYQNRLYALRSTKRIVPPNAFWLLQGFNNAMSILQTAVQKNVLNNWFNRLNGVLVRYTPYPTSDFKTIRKLIYENTLRDPNTFGDQPTATILSTLFEQITSKYQQYALNPTPRPDFLVLQSDSVLANSIAGPDYDNVDIPVFYHRIGTSDLVDSQGRRVRIPNSVTIYNTAAPPPPFPQIQQNLAHLALGNTFFPNPPTAAIVRQGQVNVLLGQGTFNNRVGILAPTILAGLGVQNPPANPGVLIP